MCNIPIIYCTFPKLSCFMSRKELKKAGLITLIVYFAISIAPIILTGITYNYLNYDWATKGKWRYLAAFNVTASVLFFITALLGIFLYTILFHSVMFRTFYLVIQLLSIIFIISESIFTIIGSTINWQSIRSERCYENYRGIFKNFYLLEPIMKEADHLLCSEKCMCHFTNYSAFFDFTDTTRDHNNPEAIANSSFTEGAKKVSECPNYRNHFIDILKQDEISDYFGSIQINKFINFWGKIENKFHCNAWCWPFYEVSDAETSHRIKYVKYSFSDINGGYVNNVGCYRVYPTWIAARGKAIGSLFLIASVMMSVNFAFTIEIVFGIYEEDDYEIRAKKTEKRRGNYIEDDENIDLQIEASKKNRRKREKIEDDREYAAHIDH